MKIKHMLQVFILLAIVFSPIGSIQQAQASTNSALQPDTVIITRDLSYWNASFFGYVNAGLYEKWLFPLTATHSFTITVSPVVGDLVPMLILLNGSGSELARGTGTLTSTQSTGDYSLQVQPVSGAGVYVLTIREINQASVSTSVNPEGVNVGESALVTVSLNNIPEGGYTSAEFTCTYNFALVHISNPTVTDLFGPDPAVAINDPQNGSFIVAVAGSNGNKATTSGAALTFSVKGLQVGQTTIKCDARVSKGDNMLTSLTSTGTDLTIGPGIITPTYTPTGSITPTSTFTETPTPTGSITPTSTFTETPTPTGSLTPTATSTFTETPTPSITFTPTDTGTPSSTPTVTASPTPTQQPPGTLTGKVLAGCKQVTVYVRDAQLHLVATVNANLDDGTFTAQVPAGAYIVDADAEGFLAARAGTIDPVNGTTNPVVIIASGGTATMQTITLLAGDIFKVDYLLPAVIDEWDAMSIGINYGKAEPTAADLNCDGTIDVLDLQLLAKNYRAQGPTPWNPVP